MFDLNLFRLPTFSGGLLIVGIGLLLMRGLDAGSAWTHLIPGMIVAGAGAGVAAVPRCPPEDQRSPARYGPGRSVT